MGGCVGVGCVCVCVMSRRFVRGVQQCDSKRAEDVIPGDKPPANDDARLAREAHDWLEAVWGSSTASPGTTNMIVELYGLRTCF